MSEQGLRELKLLSELKGLKVGDTIVVIWNSYFVKHHPGASKIMVYEIGQIKEKDCEVICDIDKNHFFNYKLFANNESNAEKVYLYEQIVAEGFKCPKCKNTALAKYWNEATAKRFAPEMGVKAIEPIDKLDGSEDGVWFTCPVCELDSDRKEIRGVTDDN